MPPHERFLGSRFPARGPKPVRPVPPIEAVSRSREDAVYFGRGHKPRRLTISLPRVKGFFEKEISA